MNTFLIFISAMMLAWSLFWALRFGSIIFDHPDRSTSFIYWGWTGIALVFLALGLFA